MTGRPRNPNKPPATKMVRLSERAYRKLIRHHEGQEPYGNTFERLTDQVNAEQKKAADLGFQILELKNEIEELKQANNRLSNIIAKRDELITKYGKEDEIRYVKAEVPNK